MADDDGVPVVLRILVKKDQDLQKTTEEIKAAVEDIFQVKATADPFADLKTKAENALASLEVTREAIQRTFGGDSSANLALLEGITRDLQIWQAYNGELIKQNPELRDAYRGTYAEAKARVEEVSAALQAQAKVAEQAAKESADAEKAALAEVAQAAKDSAQAQREASQSVKQASREASQESLINGRIVQQLGSTLGLALSAAGAGLLGLAGAAVKSAAEFEQMEVRLQGIRGSADSAAKALALVREYAGEKGFELKGLEEASLKLEQFGLKTEDTLTTVANLAAAKGKAIEGTAQVLGLVAEGDERVFKILARQYQITATDLRQYGAVVDDVKNKVINNTEVAEQNVKAVMRLVAAKWGDASAKQADTMTGAFNQAKNSVTLLANSFGKELEPFVVGGLKALTSTASFVDSVLTPQMKAAAAVMAVVAGAMAVTGGAAVALAAKLYLVNVQLERMAKDSVLASTGLSKLQGIQTGLAGGIGRLASGAVELITSFGGMAAAIAALIALYGTKEIDAYTESQKKLGDAIKSTADKAVAANKDFRETLGIVSDLAKKHNIEMNLTGDAKAQIEQLGKLWNKFTDEEIVQGFVKAGYSEEKFKEQIKGLTAETQDADAKAKVLRESIETLMNPPSDPNGFSEGNALIAVKENLKGAGLEALAAAPSIRAMREALAGFELTTKQTGIQLGILEKGFEIFKRFIDPLKAATQEVGNLKDYLRFSEQIGSAESLAGALQAVEKQITDLGNLPGLKGHTKEELLQKLGQSDVTPEVRENIKAYLEASEQRDRILKKDQKRQDDAVKEQLRQDKLLFDEKRARGQATLQDELDMVEKELANYRLSTEEKIRLEEKAAHLRKEIPKEHSKAEELAFRELKVRRDVSLKEELAFAQEQVKIFKDNAEQRVHWEERAAQITKEIQQKAVKDARDILQSQYEATREVVDKVKSDAEHTPAQSIMAINGVVAALMKWKAANGQVLASSAELRKEFDALVRTTNNSKDAEKNKQFSDNLRLLKEELTRYSASAVGESQKLLAIDQEIAFVKKAQNDHLITQKQAQIELAELDKQRLVTLKAQTAEQAQQAIKLANLQVQAQQKEVQTLEKRQGRGEEVGGELKKAQGALFNDRLAALDRETDEQIRKAGGAQDQINIIAKEAALKRLEIVEQETEHQVEEYEKRKKAFEDHQKQMDDLASGKKKSKLGFSGFDAFELPGFGEDFDTSQRYKGGQDKAFLGDDTSRGFGNFGDGDTSPAALYRSILAKLTAQAAAKTQAGPPTLTGLPISGLPDLKGLGAINPLQIQAQAFQGLTNDALQSTLSGLTAPSRLNAQRDNSTGNAAAASDPAFAANRNASGASRGSGITNITNNNNFNVNGVKGGPIDDVELNKAIERILDRKSLLKGNSAGPF